MAERKAFLLRLDPAVWAALERLAQAELRSVNAQIGVRACSDPGQKVGRRGRLTIRGQSKL